jgi:hypothetical protein
LIVDNGEKRKIMQRINRVSHSRETILKKLENKFIPEPNTGCWLWIAAHKVSLYQYGVFTISKVNKSGRIYLKFYAHRLMYMLNKGPIPKGMHVLHHCDQPCCVNPDHLYVGTNSDNLRDKIKRNRKKFIWMQKGPEWRKRQRAALQHIE